MESNQHLWEAVVRTLDCLCKEKRLTKTRLAEISALQKRHIFSIYKGKRSLTLCAIYSICEALEIPVDRFIRQVEKERQRLQNSPWQD